MAESEQQGSTAKQYGKGAALLSVGIGITGLVTYAYFAIASHVLSRHNYGLVTLLWSSVFITVAIFYRPVEQLLSRTISERMARGHVGSEPFKVAGLIQLGLAAVFLVLVLAFRRSIQNELFSGSEQLYWIMVVAVLAYAASYFARGVLAGLHKFGLYGILVFAEAVSRVLFAVVVAIGLVDGENVVAMGIAAAPLVSLIVVPWAFGRKAGELTTGSPEAKEGADEFTLSHGTGFAVAVLLIMLSEQTIMNAGPLVVKSTEGALGTALAGFVFNILLVARAPLQLFQAIQTSLLPHLTKMTVENSRDAFKKSIQVTNMAIAAFSAFVAITLAVIGPQLMHLAFGPKFEYDRIGLVIVAIGMGLYLAAATLNQAALAQGQARRAAVCWITSAIFFVGWLLLSGISDAGRLVETGFVVTALLLCGLLYAVYRRPAHVHREEIPREGSPEEVETFLSEADEV